MELAVYERNQPLEGVAIPLAPLEQQSGDLRGGLSNAVILIPELS
jgi:hypothetical protein